MKRGVIFAGGDFSVPANLDEILKSAYLVVCADSGYDNALKAGAKADAVIGDMDSVEKSLPEDAEIIRLKCEKDDTDTQAAIDYLADKGCDEIVLLGALGGRVDHQIANIMLTVYALKKGVSLVIEDENSEIILIENYAEFEGKTGDILTLVPILSDAEGVTLSGLKYPLDGATLQVGKTVGVSNEFICEKATVKVDRGMILAIKTKR